MLAALGSSRSWSVEHDPLSPLPPIEGGFDGFADETLENDMSEGRTFSCGRWGLKIGPVFIRGSRKHLAPWGFEAMRIGGLSLWSRDSGGDLVLASYHPRWSTTWFWSASISRRDSMMFSRETIAIDRQLYAEGNPYAPKPTWKRHFCRLTDQHQGQWHDYYRLPFGRVLRIGHQDYHIRQQQYENRRRELYAKFGLKDLQP